MAGRRRKPVTLRKWISFFVLQDGKCDAPVRHAADVGLEALAVSFAREDQFHFSRHLNLRAGKQEGRK